MKPAFLIATILLLIPSQIFAKEQPDLAHKLAGQILLQVESYGRAWYVSPRDYKRYYLKDASITFEIIKKLGLGIREQDLKKIPEKKGERLLDKKLAKRLNGATLLNIDRVGEAWYVNPVDGLRYYLPNGETAFEIFKRFARGISNKDLRSVPMSDSQIAFDATFSGVAYAKYTNGTIVEAQYGDTILPLASLTKLMTALVFLNTNPDWEGKTIITENQINYPRYYVGNDPTSEIDLRAGDSFAIENLWTAMLLASSNQATVALVDATGIPRGEFVKLMNQKAKELGLQKTVFVDVTGLDAHNLSTPKDTAILADEAFRIPRIAETTKIVDYAIMAVNSQKTARNIMVKNRNFSLSAFAPDATKTGFLAEAQRNVALKKNSDIIVVMHANSMRERNSIIRSLLNAQ